MADSNSKSPHESLWAKLARHHTPRTLQYRLVHYGFWSSGVMLICMLLNLVVPSLFGGHYVAIGMTYLCFQLAEIASRNPLKPGEVIEGIVLAFAPAIISFLFIVLDWKSGYSMMTTSGWYSMGFWFICSWIGFIDGVWMAIQILETPYRRNESIAPRT